MLHGVLQVGSTFLDGIRTRQPFRLTVFLSTLNIPVHDPGDLVSGLLTGVVLDDLDLYFLAPNTLSS